MAYQYFEEMLGFRTSALKWVSTEMLPKKKAAPSYLEDFGSQSDKIMSNLLLQGSWSGFEQGFGLDTLLRFLPV